LVAPLIECRRRADVPEVEFFDPRLDPDQRQI